jgi:phage terminase Nu1 subunit (DNA packaging protein)
MSLDLDKPIKQSVFAALVGVTPAAISQAISGGRLEAGATGRQWLLAYCERLREQAAGRGSDGQLNLVDERAALAQAQRKLVELSLAEKQGKLLPAALIEPLWAAAAVAARELLQRSRHALARKLGGVSDAKKREQIIGEVHDDFLRTLAQWRRPDAKEGEQA